MRAGAAQHVQEEEEGRYRCRRCWLGRQKDKKGRCYFLNWYLTPGREAAAPCTLTLFPTCGPVEDVPSVKDTSVQAKEARQRWTCFWQARFPGQPSRRNP